MSVRYLNAWVFAILMLVGQASLLVHQVDIDQHADEDSCLICDLAVTPDGLGHDFPETRFFACVDAQVTPPHTRAFSSRKFVLSHNRAPPATFG